MVREMDGKEARDGGRSSWLAGLLDPDRGRGRIKAGTLRLLWLLGLTLVIGIGLMGVGDLLRPRSSAVYDAAGSPADRTGSAASVGGSAPAATSQGTSGVLISVAELEAMVERGLERILSRIEGAGTVAVAVSFETGATYVYGYNETQTLQTTEERDAQGGTRLVTQTNSSRSVVLASVGSGSQPVVVRIELPPIRGVVVVASGAADSRVKAVLSQAVQILYGLPANKVVVLAGG